MCMCGCLLDLTHLSPALGFRWQNKRKNTFCNNNWSRDYHRSQTCGRLFLTGDNIRACKTLCEQDSRCKGVAIKANKYCILCTGQKGSYALSFASWTEGDAYQLIREDYKSSYGKQDRTSLAFPHIHPSVTRSFRASPAHRLRYCIGATVTMFACTSFYKKKG